MLKKKGLSTGLGDEGGFAPSLPTNRAALDLIAEAVEAAGFKLGTDIVLAMDVAATEFYKDGAYVFEGSPKSAEEMINYYAKLVETYPIVSIEDPLSEDDWAGWSALTAQLGDKIQIVGDDLFVTNPTGSRRGIDEKSANAPARQGQPDRLADRDAGRRGHGPPGGLQTMMSHRSGETEDTTIADLAVAVGSGQIKTGAPARSDRVAKYNQLLRIEEELGDAARYAGAGAFPSSAGRTVTARILKPG